MYQSRAANFNDNVSIWNGNKVGKGQNKTDFKYKNVLFHKFVWYSSVHIL